MQISTNKTKVAMAMINMLKYNKKVDNMQEEINNISRQVISKKEF